MVQKGIETTSASETRIVDDIISLDDKRLHALHAPFNPITGEGSIGDRVPFRLPGFPLTEQFLPRQMMDVPMVRMMQQAGSLEAFVEQRLNRPFDQKARDTVVEAFVRLRSRYDFPFWAAFFVFIKNKRGGDDVRFRLTPPQRRIVSYFEECRTAGRPIRLILLKARQLGGSTVIQIYMSWLQLVQRTGLNSLIISLQTKASDEIFDMYDRMIAAYPVSMLHRLGEAYDNNEKKFENVGMSGAIKKVPQRNCKIKLGTAEKPDSCRGGDYSLVHLSEVGLWPVTTGKAPQDIVQAACSGILLKPYTMIVYESTARGTGNFFHAEYTAAKAGKSLYKAMFIPWFDIPQWSLPFESPQQRHDFALWLWQHRNQRNALSLREEPGRYLWWVWNNGASLEALNWYVRERAGRDGHSKMSAEFPSDDVEAFTDIDTAIFDRYQVERFAPACRDPRFIGEVYGQGDEGEAALSDVRFHEDRAGSFAIWEKPEIDDNEKVANRYLTVVDIGGRSDKADWSVIVVFDRLMMADGEGPAVVAQWYGHIDMDLLAWKSAQIARYYDDALLVIESNTLETHERERYVDGDQSGFILNLIKDVYPNLYARRQSEDDIRNKVPRKYGFHTNTATKPMVISTLQKVIREHLYTERDSRCLHQYLVFERKPNGSTGAVPGDHDDLLMTRAIGLHIAFREMDLPVIVPRQARYRSTRKKVISAATI